jgi:hypothetical protein
MTPKKDKEEPILEAMIDRVGERGFHTAPMSLLAKRSGASVDVNLSLPLLCYSQTTLMPSEK